MLQHDVFATQHHPQCKHRRERFTPYQDDDFSHTIPTDRKKEDKAKTSEDKKGTSSLGQQKSIGPARQLTSSTPSTTGSPGVLETALVHKFHITYSHTECNSFSMQKQQKSSRSGVMLNLPFNKRYINDRL